jgi:S1-C subfamily serine protease
VRGFAKHGVALVGAGTAGAAIALGVVAAAGSLGSSSTTVREVLDAAPAEPASFGSATKPLTIHDVFLRAAPGVVQVTASSRVGSGFVIDKAGHIVTNYHVVRDARHVLVSFSNDERLVARVVGRDQTTGVAVLQLNAQSRALTPLELGNSDLVRVGDSVAAIGNPLGRDRSITSGIVTARNIALNGTQIETDAATSSGNVGGPLLDARGKVIGVNAQGFAIPIDTAKNVAAQLIAKGVVEHPFVGVGTRAITARVATLFRLPVRQGLLVGRVCPNSSAAKAGVRGPTQQVTLAGVTWPLGGDIIVKVDGMPVTAADELRAIVGAKKPGDSVELELERRNATVDVNVKLEREPVSLGC